MNTAVHFSSASDEWETPQWLFDELNKEFGFTLDVCATHENRKCKAYFNKGINGLEQSWQGEVCWMNPPYGNPEFACEKNCKKKACVERGYHINEYKPGIKDWVCKAYDESKKGTTVVCLLPARTDTIWFHAYILGRAEIRFLQGRLKFGNATNSAPFPSMIVVFRGCTP
jgi:phage N-6-adenine-methyltransferase